MCDLIQVLCQLTIITHSVRVPSFLHILSYNPVCMHAYTRNVSQDGYTESNKRMSNITKKKKELELVELE